MPSDPRNENESRLWSVAGLAQEFGMSRATVARRLASAGVRPECKRLGYGVFRLRDACPAILAPLIQPDTAAISDVDRMRPGDRRAYWQSQNERQKFLQNAGELIPAAEVHQQMASIAKLVVRFLEALPDVVERDTHCDSKIVEYLVGRVRSIRMEIANQIESHDKEPGESCTQ
jgi:hypothetical protein